MPKISYIKKRFSGASLKAIEHANSIITEYSQQGFTLTLRQLYYQFVSRDLISNRQSEYKKLGSVINDARLAGYIDWYTIEDRTRGVRSLPRWENPSEILNSCAEQYRVDKWSNQEWRPRVWIEKDALVGVIEVICKEFDVPYFSCRGYTSQSEMWSAARSFQVDLANGQTPIILHFGDHDPSGIDMTRDITDRLELFMGGLKVDRLALNFDQVEEYKPPPNPAKMTDTRYGAYITKFGDESWELDAMEPAMLVKLIRKTILSYRNKKKWAESLEKENYGKGKIREISESMEEK